MWSHSEILKTPDHELLTCKWTQCCITLWNRIHLIKFICSLCNLIIALSHITFSVSHVPLVLYEMPTFHNQIIFSNCFSNWISLRNTWYRNKSVANSSSCNFIIEMKINFFPNMTLFLLWKTKKMFWRMFPLFLPIQ